MNLSLGFAPATATNLTFINNTGPGFIQDRFANLAQGQSITLTYGGSMGKMWARCGQDVGKMATLLEGSSRSGGVLAAMAHARSKDSRLAAFFLLISWAVGKMPTLRALMKP